MGRSIDRDAHPALDKWLTAIEGSATPQTVSGDDVECDFCQSPISPGTRFTNYLADTLVNEEYAGYEGEGNPFYFLRAYCAECDRRELLHPCQGYVELLLEGELDAERRLQNLELIDFSGRDDGIPYDPVEVWNTLHRGTSWENFQQTLGKMRGHVMRLGPADITDDLLYHDVEPRDVFDPDGEIRLRERDIEDLAKKFEK